MRAKKFYILPRRRGQESIDLMWSISLTHRKMLCIFSLAHQIDQKAWISCNPSRNRRFEIRSVWSTKKRSSQVAASLFSSGALPSFYPSPNPSLGEGLCRPSASECPPPFALVRSFVVTETPWCRRCPIFADTSSKNHRKTLLVSLILGHLQHLSFFFRIFEHV